MFLKKIKKIIAWCWATLPRRIVSCLIIFSILLSSAWYLFLRPQPVEAAWYDNDWLYRKSIAVTNNTTAETNKYISVTIDTSDTTKYQTDCGDLRFTKLSGELLDYFILSGCGGSTIVHILFDTFPAGAQTIYYYYGNISADNGFKSADFSTVATNYTVGAIGSEEKGTGPVLWLKFDEGYSTAAKDFSDQNNDGTISGATWITSGCKYGKCLDFDGSNDVVTVTQAASINLTSKTAYTVSVWAYPHSDGEADVGEIIDKGANTYIRVDSQGTDGYLDVEAKLGLAATSANLNAADAVQLNRWSHIVMVYEDDSDDEIDLYVSGILKGTSVNGDGSPASDSNDLLVGGDSAANFDGLVDEIKIYPYARSAAQIKRDFNQGAAGKVGVDDSWLTDGLVGWWKMDEASWNGTSGEVIDSSGAGNNGTRAGDATTSSTAKFNRAGTFDGNGDYVNMGNPSILNISGNITVSAWVKLSASQAGRWIVSRYDGAHDWFSYALFMSTSVDNTIRFVIYTTTSGGVATSARAYYDGKWHLLTGVYNGSNVLLYIDGGAEAITGSALSGPIDTSHAVNVCIGAQSLASYPFIGLIDDVMIFNRALSAQEVSRLYDMGLPAAAQWKFDEKTGSTANDSSGNGNTGTVSGASWKGSSDCKYGNCLDYDGTDDATAVSANSSVDLKNKGGYSVCGWVNPDTDGEGDAGEWFSKGNSYVRVDTESSSAVNVSALFDLATADASLTTTLTIPTASWSHICVNWEDDSDDELTIYINGISAGSSTNGDGSAADDSASAISIGGDSSNNFDGKIDQVNIYQYSLTPKQIYNDMMAGAPRTPVGYWKFDEGFGTTAEDSSGQGNDLTLSAESYTMSGKFGRAWDGDGVRYLSRADDSDFDFAATDDFTISTWFKSDSASNPYSNEFLVNKYSAAVATGYAIYLDTGGDVIFGIDNDATWTPADKAGDVSRDFYDNTWHQAIAVKWGTSRIEMYVDGVLINSDTSISASGTLENSATLYIGDKDGTNNGDEFTGDIDEAKIYRFALSPEEVLMDYNQGKALRVGGSSPTVGVFCPPGYAGTCAAPVGEWKIDERTDNVCTGGANDACDTSANTNDGAINGNPVWKGAGSCKFGSCLSFDGTGDYINVPDSSILSFPSTGMSISVWVNPAALPMEGGIIGKYGMAATREYGIWITTISTNRIYVRLYDESVPAYIGGRAASSLLTAGSWNHIVMSYNGGINNTDIRLYINGIERTLTASSSGTYAAMEDLTSLLRIGYVPAALTGTFNGFIDDVKIFNYALTQEQIAWLYNQGDPVGYWKFDQGQGTTATDSSVNNNSGTISGAAWSASGKYNSGLDFDGTDDVVTVTQDADINLTSKLSYAVSAWVYPHTSGESDSVGGQIISKGTDTYLRVDTSSGGRVNVSGSLDLATTDATSNISSAIPLNQWSHILMSYADDSDDEISIYINGVLAGVSANGDGSPATDSNDLLIGGSTSANFDGLIDEVKIYNYEPTTEQVKQDYNQGAALRFGQ